MAEGPKVVGDLLRRYQPVAVYATEEWITSTGSATGDQGDRSLILNGIKRPVPLIPVSDEELRRISFLQHPQQVLALFPIPDSTTAPADLSLITYHLSLALALDGVQDPGNLGTIIRIADWFGIDTIYCSEDTADAYNPKVVQATMGSIARVNIIYTDLVALLDSLPPSFPIYGTLLDGEDIYQQSLSTEGIIVMGNEGNGISEPIRQKVNRRLLIPRFREGDTAESLNVAIATAITCSEFRRRT